MFTSRDHPAVPAAQPQLSLPCDRLDLLGLTLEFSSHVGRPACGMTVSPGSFDQHTADMAISGFGDRANSAGQTCAMERRDKTDKGHQFSGLIKARQISEFRADCRGDHQ